MLIKLMETKALFTADRKFVKISRQVFVPFFVVLWQPIFFNTCHEQFNILRCLPYLSRDLHNKDSLEVTLGIIIYTSSFKMSKKVKRVAKKG